MKKGTFNKLFLTFILLSVVLSIVSVCSFSVSAAEDITPADVEAGVKETGAFLNAVLSPLFGEGELVTRVAFAVLIFMLVYSVLSMVLAKGWIGYISSGAVTVLAMIAMPSGALEAIRTQYGAMGAALITIIPIVILLVFTARISSLMVAKLMWVTFFLYYFILLIYGMIFEEAGANGWYIVATVITIIGFFAAGFLRKEVFKLEVESLKEEGEKIVARGGLLHKLQKEELEGSYGGK